jgi:hypothetical protein
MIGIHQVSMPIVIEIIQILAHQSRLPAKFQSKDTSRRTRQRERGGAVDEGGQEDGSAHAGKPR